MSLPRVLLSLLFIFIVFTLVKNIIDYQDKIKFYNQYQQEYEAQKKKNLSLQTEILKKTDPFEVEKTIRNKLNLSKEGEIDIILPKPSPTPVIVTPTPLPNWRQWWNVFFKTN